MENIKSIEESILRYTWASNETEREAIREKIDQCWSAAGTLTDKVTNTITGRHAITELIISSHDQMRPRTFTVPAESATDYGNGHFCRLIIRPEGYPAEGMDYFTRIVGFF